MMQEVFPLVISVHMRYLGPFVLVLCALSVSEKIMDIFKFSLVGRRSAR